MYEEMRKVGRLLAGRGVVVATGALGGIGMQAGAEGAAQSGGRIVGYTYGGKNPNRYVTETVDCQALASDVPFDAGYCVRLAGLLSSDAFVIAGSGGAGTFLELIATINFNQKFWSPMKRTAILEMHSKGGAWNEGMLAELRRWGVLTEETFKAIRVVKSAAEAVRWVSDGAL